MPLDPRSHPASINSEICRAHLTGERHSFTGTNTEETPALAALKADMLDNDRWFQQYVGSCTPEQLQEVLRFTFTDGDKGAMSRAELLLHVITHGGYYRGNVGEMLDVIGIQAPRDLYTRFLHDTEPARRQT